MDSQQASPLDFHLLSQALAVCSVGVVISDARLPDFPIVYANTAFEQLSGYQAQEILGRNCRFLQGSDYDQAGASEVRQAIALQRTTTIVLRNYRQDGSLFYNELTLSPIHAVSGLLTHYVGFQKDVTQREQALQEQAQLQQTLSSTLERVTDGIVSFDLDWNIRYVNKAVAAMVARLPSEVSGRNLFELFPASTHSPDAQALQRAAATGLVQREVGYSAAVERWLEATAYPSGDGVSLFVRDLTQQHQAQEQQRASDERFSLVFEAAPVGIVVTRISDGCYLDANPEFVRLSGYIREDIIGHTGLELNFWVDLTQRADIWRTVREQGKLDSHEAQFRRQSGVVADTLVSMVPVTLGEEACVLALIRDITPEKRAQRELEESERHARQIAAELQHTLDLSLDMIITLGPDTQIISVSAACQRILGYLPGELIGRSYLDFVHPDDQAVSRARRDSITEAQFVNIFQNRYLHKDGQIVWIEWNAVMVPGDPMIYCVARDVTQRRVAEEDQAFLAAMVEASHSAIVGVGLDNIIRSWNAAATELYGYSTVQAIGQPMTLISPPELHSETTLIFCQAMQGEHIGAFETVRIAQDGRRIPVMMTVSAIHNPQGQVIGVAQIMRDITAMQVAEHNVRLLNQTLEQQVRYITGLREIDQAIASSGDLTATLGLILENIRQHLGANAATALTLNPHTLTLEYVATRGLHATALQGSTVRLEQGLAGQAVLSRQSLSISDLNTLVLAPDWQEVAKRDGIASYYAAPLIARGKVIGVIEVLHQQRFAPSDGWLETLETLVGQASIAVEDAQLLTALERRNLELRLAYEETIEGWARALDLRDHETEGHSRRVTELTVALCQQLGIPPEQLVHVRRGALLHDIGKMGIRDAVLLKPGKLTDEEWVEMKKHPGYAVDLLHPIRFLRPALDIPEYHHEKWDGSGYPLGLRGAEIPVAARAFALVDVYDALTSQRPYRQAWTREQTLDHIQNGAGTHFDPDLVLIFMQMIQGS